MSASPDRWRQVEALFYEALELPPEARPEFLDKNCEGDADLRTEIESLIASAQQPMDFLHQPVREAAQRLMTGSRDQMFAPGAQFAQYTIISKLGSGGMGEVYLAEDSRLRRKVALKIIGPEISLDERGLLRFEFEARAASALNHPNILTIYEFGQNEGVRFIACEFVEGSTVRQKLATGRLTLNDAVDVAIQIAGALAAAHDRGIVHRDIKPENVILRGDGIVKILDFGIAKLGRGATNTKTSSLLQSPVSETGLVVGTAKYMSPEQARGLEVDRRTDIFSLGSVMYEMVTGRAAFEGDTSSDVIAEILKGEPPPAAQLAPDIPREVEGIVAKALRKNPEERYQSVRDLQADLQNFKEEAEFQAKLHGGVRPEQAGSDSRRPMRESIAVRNQGLPRRRALWLLAAVLAVIVAIVGYFFARKTSVAELPRPRSLAVLPFRNLKQDPESDFLGFSLANEVITRLSYVNALTVRPSTSVDKYRNQNIDPKKAASELRVDTLLTGSFIRDGDNLRITAQLVDVKSDKILWRDAMDLKYDNLLTVQNRVSQEIVKELEVNLSPAEAANLKPEKPISGAAYEYYLRGVDLYSLNQFAQAIEMLEKSTATEPNYAPAWAHLGRAYTTYASLQFGGREDYVKAQNAYQKAIALNPALLEPRIYMSNLLTDTGRVEEAVRLLRTVLHDSPNNAEAHWELGYAYRFGGSLEESVAECEKARANDPQVKISSSAMNAYLYLGEYDKFLQSLPANDSVYIRFYRGFGAYYANNREQAAQDFDNAYERDPSLLPVVVGKALSDSIRHDNTAGLKLLKQTEGRIEERGVSDPELLYKVAQAYAVLGDKESALHMLRHSIGGGFFCYSYFARDPLLQSLRNEPEFQTLLNQALDRSKQFNASFF